MFGLRRIKTAALVIAAFAAGLALSVSTVYAVATNRNDAINTLTIDTSVVLGASSVTGGTYTGGTWNGNVITPAYGGTGIANNAASTITITGAYGTTITVTGTTGVTLPTSGTLATLAGSEELTHKTLNASVAKGTWTASGTWTLPAHTFGGAVTATGQTITGGTYSGPTLNGTVAGTPTWASTQALNTSGNAATATALETARTINGTSFNGTANITVTAAGSTLTGTSLASGIVSSSLTSVGTLAGVTIGGQSTVNLDTNGYGVTIVDTKGGGAANQFVSISLSKGGGASAYYELLYNSQQVFTWGGSFSTYAGVMRLRNPLNNTLILGTNDTDRVTIGATGGVQVGSPTGGDKGSGTINVAGDIYKNDTAYTNPDYVFERFHGQPVNTARVGKQVDEPACAARNSGKPKKDQESCAQITQTDISTLAVSYPGLQPLTAVKAYIDANNQLPRVSVAQGMFERSDVLLEKTEEAYLYLIDQDARLKLLESQLANLCNKHKGEC